jgi:membrane-anchored protein YejM (alkaline phosphatase superfamily)
MVENENTYGERVSRLVGWGHWFAFFNIIAAMLIGTRYISQSPWPETLLGQFYLAVSWVGHFGFLVFAIYLLFLFPLTFLIPSRKLFRFFAVCFATGGLTVLLIDTQVYHKLNLHLTPVVWEVLFSDDSKTTSKDLQHLFVLLPLFFALEMGISEWVWKKQRRLSHKHVGRPLATIFFICFTTSHLIYVWSDASLYTPVTSQKSNLPLSYPMTAKSFMERHGLFDRAEYLKRLHEKQEHNTILVDYPLEPLKFDRRINPLNILLVSVNNLRADMLNPRFMPLTSAFARNNLDFRNHYSSSNDMFGIFGLFYGLPSSYASSIKVQGTLPILLDTLKSQKYHFGLFSGNNFSDTLYAETVFRGLPLNNTSFTKTATRDEQTIDTWSKWVTKQSDTRWFSYLELVSVQDYDAPDNSFEHATDDKLRSNYEQSVLAADREIGLLIQKLYAMDIMDSTIVVITSNHGTEFNETKSNSWGSNTNYSQYQLKVPMVIHWPGKVAAEYNQRTSHLDFSVTLMQDLLGVSSNPNDYSSGQNLFDENKRRWILAGDARELALITDNQTTVIDKFGNFKVFDEHYRRLPETNPTLPVLMQGLTELKRFYSKDN